MRYEVAGIGEATSFAIKPELARRMIECAPDAGVPCAWVTGDTRCRRPQASARVARRSIGPEPEYAYYVVYARVGVAGSAGWLK